MNSLLENYHSPICAWQEIHPDVEINKGHLVIIYVFGGEAFHVGVLSVCPLSTSYYNVWQVLKAFPTIKPSSRTAIAYDFSRRTSRSHLLGT